MWGILAEEGEGRRGIESAISDEPFAVDMKPRAHMPMLAFLRVALAGRDAHRRA